METSMISYRHRSNSFAFLFAQQRTRFMVYDEHNDSWWCHASPSISSRAQTHFHFAGAQWLAVASLKWPRPHLVMQHTLSQCQQLALYARSISPGTLPHTHTSQSCPSVFSSLCSSRSNYDYSAVWHMLLRRHSGALGANRQTTNSARSQ